MAAPLIPFSPVLVKSSRWRCSGVRARAGRRGGELLRRVQRINRVHAVSAVVIQRKKVSRLYSYLVYYVFGMGSFCGSGFSGFGKGMWEQIVGYIREAGLDGDLTLPTASAAAAAAASAGFRLWQYLQTVPRFNLCVTVHPLYASCGWVRYGQKKESGRLGCSNYINMVAIRLGWSW